MEKRKPNLQSLPCATGLEYEKQLIQEGMREARRRAIQELCELRTEPTMHNLDGFYSRIKEKDNK